MCGTDTDNYPIAQRLRASRRVHLQDAQSGCRMTIDALMSDNPHPMSPLKTSDDAGDADVGVTLNSLYADSLMHCCHSRIPSRPRTGR